METLYKHNMVSESFWEQIKNEAATTIPFEGWAQSWMIELKRAPKSCKLHQQSTGWDKGEGDMVAVEQFHLAIAV